MRNLMKATAALATAGLISIAASSQAAAAITLIDNSTTGYYNDGIGGSLNGTSALFPDAGTSDDPNIDPAPEPDLSAASAALGAWLSTPSSPGGTWSGSPVAIPSTWAVETETAIIYEIDAGATGLSNVVASFGVDNGIFVWLDGVYLGGELHPGGASLGELILNIGNLTAGSHFLQVLREDHGGATGYAVQVTGDEGVSEVPLPAALPIFLSGLAGVGFFSRKKRKSARA